MEIRKITSFFGSLIDNALDTFELISDETDKARIRGLQRSLVEDLSNTDLTWISTSPQNFYQALRRHNSLSIGRNIIHEIASLKRLGETAEGIDTYLADNLPKL